MSRLFCCLIALALLIPSGLSGRTQSELLPATFQIALENQYVRVYSADVPHGVKSSYTAPEGLAAVVIRLRHVYGFVGYPLPDLQPLLFDRVLFLKSGQVSNHADPDLNSIREIRIELKDSPPTSPFDRDAVKLDPSHNKVLLENASVRVVDVHFGLGEKGPVVDKRPRVIILLNDMHADVAKHDGDTPSPRDGKSGVIQWSLGGSQATMNRNETKLDNIVVEIKGK